MSTGIDYAELIDKVLADEQALDYFRDLWCQKAYEIFNKRERLPNTLRVSDAGSCRLALWAELKEKRDLPESVKAVDSRMQPGILDGARTAYLIAAGIRRWYWPLTTLIEPAFDACGIPGHADLIVCAEPEVLEVVECKLTFYTKAIEDPKVRHMYWLHQACRYAQGFEAPNFVVLVHAPAVWNGPTRKSFRYATADYVESTAVEYMRLAAAIAHDPPEADAQEDWRCKSCRYSQCERNVNPLRPTVDTIVDELGALA